MMMEMMIDMIQQRAQIKVTLVNNGTQTLIFDRILGLPPSFLPRSRYLLHRITKAVLVRRQRLLLTVRKEVSLMSITTFPLFQIKLDMCSIRQEEWHNLFLKNYMNCWSRKQPQNFMVTPMPLWDGCRTVGLFWYANPKNSQMTSFPSKWTSYL